IVMPQKVFREVEPGGGKEPRARHALAVLQHRALAPVGADVGKSRELDPEFFRMRHGPGVDRLVSVELDALAGADAGGESCEVGVGDTGRRWAPDLAHGFL